MDSLYPAAFGRRSGPDFKIERRNCHEFSENITSVFKTAGGAVQDAVGVVAEKNRKTRSQTACVL